MTDREDYQAGDMIRGKVVFELFHPTSQRDLYLRFSGETLVPDEHVNKVDEERQKEHLIAV